MNEEDLRLKIQFLEEENARLRKLTRPTRIERSIFPERLRDKYGESYMTMRGRVTNALPCFSQGDLRDIGLLVRRTCFVGKKEGLKDCSIALDEMTDEQYDKYSDIYEKVVDVLAEYALPVKERTEVVRR